MGILDPSTDNNLLFKEKISDVYVNLAATYSNIVAYAYDENGTLFDKWSRTVQVGYKTIFVIDNETVEFYIERGSLITMKSKKVHLEIKVIQNVISKELTDDKEHTDYEYDLMVGDTKMESLE
jgi:hypothetical protein